MTLNLIFYYYEKLRFVTCLYAIAASAQYCSIQKGQKLYYEVLTGKKKTETYTEVSLQRIHTKAPEYWVTE